MKRSHFIVLGVALVAAALLFNTAGQRSRNQGQELTSVFVSNFPTMQQVQGIVEIEEPVPVAKQIAFREEVVPPVKRSQTTRFIDLGVVETKGFTNAVISLHGQVQGQVTKNGEIGVILLPDEPTILEAFNEQGLIQFGMEAVAGGVNNRTSYFASEQPRYALGFERYRALLYNSTDKTVRVDLFTYLTN